jgi:hypothetical protein
MLFDERLLGGWEEMRVEETAEEFERPGGGVLLHTRCPEGH